MTNEVLAYNYCQETIDLKNNVEKNYMVLCARLYKIKNERLYEAQFEQWELFLEELRINKRRAEAMIKIYETFVLQLGINPDTVALAGGWSVAETLLPIATTKEDAEEGLEFARNALRKDVRLYVNEKRFGVKEVMCRHADTYLVRICRGCGERWEEYEVEHKHV